MYQFYIIEIIKGTEGYSHNVYWEFDTNRDKARRKAEAKAYSLLAVAAVDENYLHSVTVLSDDGFKGIGQCYQNVKEPEPEENNG